MVVTLTTLTTRMTLTMPAMSAAVRPLTTLMGPTLVTE